MNDRNKRRPRRIASDEALAWARNLKLKNVHAKIVLMMLSLYIDSEGVAWVGAGTLAADCELSDDTVRRRLAWLAEIGAIARMPQWIDDNGRRNTDGRGKRTTDLIRLLFEADPDEIEARATGRGPFPSQSDNEVQDEDSDDGLASAASGGLAPAACPPPAADETVSPPASLRLAPPLASALQRLHIDEPEPEPEPESPPSPPPGGVREDQGDDESLTEPAHFAPFWEAYPGREVMSRYRALEIFVTMTSAEQEHARAAAPLLRDALAKMKRRPRDAHKWLAEKGWREFPNAKIAKPQAAPSRRMIKGRELAAVNCALRIAGHQELSTVTTASEDGMSKYTEAGFWSREIGPDLLALARYTVADDPTFQFVDEGSESFAAWRDRLAVWLGIPASPIKHWLEPFDPAIHALPGSDPNFKPRKCAKAFRVPGPFPPSVTGKIYTPTGPPALPELSEQDMADFR